MGRFKYIYSLRNRDDMYQVEICACVCLEDHKKDNETTNKCYTSRLLSPSSTMVDPFLSSPVLTHMCTHEHVVKPNSYTHI